MENKIELIDWTGHKDKKQAYEWAYGINRGKLMKRFFEENNINIKDKNVLDVGCNQGGVSIAFSECSNKIISFDNEIEWIKTMEKRLKKRNIENISIFVGDANNIPLKDGFFDIVIVVGVMEWIALNKDVNPKKIFFVDFVNNSFSCDDGLWPNRSIQAQSTLEI